MSIKIGDTVVLLGGYHGPKLEVIGVVEQSVTVRWTDSLGEYHQKDYAASQLKKTD